MTPLRILVTGSRNWGDERVIAEALGDACGEITTIGLPILVVGDCPTGTDALATRMWCEWAPLVGDPEIHRADWATHGRAAGPLRNAAMVAAGADVCLAFPIGASRGTRDCIRRAEKAGIPVVVHDPPHPG